MSGRGPRGRHLDEKPKDFKNSMRQLFRYCRPWYIPIVISLVFSLAATFLTIVAPDKMADLTNAISAGLYTGIDFDSVKIVLMVPFSPASIASIKEETSPMKEASNKGEAA